MLGYRYSHIGIITYYLEINLFNKKLSQKLTQ